MQLDKQNKREEKREEYLKQLEKSINKLEVSDRECTYKIDRIHDLLIRRSENAQIKFNVIYDTIERMEDELDKISNYSKTVNKRSKINPLETLTENDTTGFL